MTAYTDPPDMPEDERMTAAEFRVIREFLGLNAESLAEYLQVSSRTVRHWESEKYDIPDGVRVAIEDLEARTAAFIGGAVEALMDIAEPAVLTYRTDAEYHAAKPDIELPASWHRAVVARIALEVPGLQIVYGSDSLPDAASAATSAATDVTDH